MKIESKVLRAVAAGAMLLAGVGTSSMSGAATPQEIADDRFDAITGPMSAFVVRPADFGIDARKVTVPVEPLISQVDPARVRSVTEQIAFPRTSSGPVSELDRATDLVDDLFRERGYEPEHQSVVLPKNGHDMPNVYAEVPGTSCPTRVLVLGAHYDSATVGNPAADDNGSGVGAFFEIARVLRDNPLPVTVRLVAWSYEEDGLVGSLAMAAKDKADGVDVVGAVSLETMGYTDTVIDPLTGITADYLAMVADPGSAPLAKAYGAAAYTYIPESMAAAAIIDPAVLPDIFRSDHAAYVLNGYQGLMTTDTANFRNPNYHKVTDTLDTIDWDFLTNGAKVGLAGAVTYASSDQNVDGYADLCRPVVEEPTDVTPTVPSAPTVPAHHTPMPVAPVARPLAADVRYTG